MTVVVAAGRASCGSLVPWRLVVAMSGRLSRASFMLAGDVCVSRVLVIACIGSISA